MSRFKRPLVAAAAVLGAATTVLAMSSPANAAVSYTPDGGPDVTFVGDNVSFTAVQANQTLTCEQFDLLGSITDPGVSRAYGAQGGVLDVLTSDNCTNPIAGDTTVDPTGVWGVTITGDPAGTVFPARLTDVSAFVEAAGCSFNAEGTVDGTFDTASQEFVPTDSGLVIADNPSGFLCPILGLAQGQDIDVNGSWTNTSPDLTITNP